MRWVTCSSGLSSHPTLAVPDLHPCRGVVEGMVDRWYAARFVHSHSVTCLSFFMANYRLPSMRHPNAGSVAILNCSPWSWPLQVHECHFSEKERKLKWRLTKIFSENSIYDLHSHCQFGPHWRKLHINKPAPIPTVTWSLSPRGRQCKFFIVYRQCRFDNNCSYLM